jgi:hypothetical protein
MLASYRVAADNALWELTLREGADVARQHASPRPRLRRKHPATALQENSGAVGRLYLFQITLK